MCHSLHVLIVDSFKETFELIFDIIILFSNDIIVQKSSYSFTSSGTILGKFLHSKRTMISMNRIGTPEATWEDRSVHTVSPSSWTVTDFTPDRITFLAISTPSPPAPAIRTLAVPIRCIASWPRTYLSIRGTRRWSAGYQSGRL